MTDPQWKQLEILIAKIQKELAPDAHVQHNVKLPGALSETNRQIDVLVTQQIGQYEMKIVIDCKDYASPIDVKGIEEFAGLVEDVRAHKSAMVCPRGFTEAAKKLAAKKQIDLYSPVDTDPHKWQVKATAPVLCKSKEMMFSIGMRTSSPGPFKMPYNFHSESEIYTEDGENIGVPVKIVRRQWNNEKYPTEVGLHENIPLYETKCFMDNGYGTRVPVDLYLGLMITEKRYFGHISIVQITGLKDEQTGQVITRNFTTEFCSPQTIVDTWQELKEDESMPISPLFEIGIMDCYEEA